MDDETLLGLFGGDIDSLNHYKLLRKIHTETYCDTNNVCEGEELEFASDVLTDISETVNDVGTMDSSLLEDSDSLKDLSHLSSSGLSLSSKEISRQSSKVHRAVLRPLDDVQYLDGEVYGFQSKQTALDNTDDSRQEGDTDQDLVTMETEESRMFECGQQGCTKKFSSLSAYESHYHSCHHFVCSACRRVFVSSFMLDVHIQENHDSYFQILSSRIDMYQCLLETCGLKFRTPDIRRDHLIKVHKYPANFNFHKPVNEKKSALPQKGSDTGMECQTVGSTGEAGKTDTKPKKLPAGVCFGRGQPKSFQRRPRQKKRLNVEKPMEER